jgi:formate dehydrogenase assembly factor FdhD
MQDRCALGKPDLVWRGAEPIPSSRMVAEERPVALTYNGSTYAVMMASPVDLHDFGIGFSLNEGAVKHSGEISSIEVIELEQGDLAGHRRRNPRPSDVGRGLPGGCDEGAGARAAYLRCRLFCSEQSPCRILLNGEV